MLFHGESQYNFQRTRNVSPEIERNWKTSYVNLKLTLFTCLSRWQEELWVIICHKSEEQWVKSDRFFKRRSRTEIYFRFTMYTEIWRKWCTTWWNKLPLFKKSPVQQNIIVLMAHMTCETVLTSCFKIKKRITNSHLPGLQEAEWLVKMQKKVLSLLWSIWSV